MTRKKVIFIGYLSCFYVGLFIICMKRLAFFVCGLFFSIGIFAQNKVDVSKYESAKYFYRTTDKSISDLKKNEVAFVYKGENYYVKRGRICKMRVDKQKLRVLSGVELYNMMSDFPELQHRIVKSQKMMKVSGVLYSATTLIPMTIGAAAGGGPAGPGLVDVLIPTTIMLVASGKEKKAIKEFYNGLIANVPNEREYSLDYKPEPFVKLTNKKAKEVSSNEPAFTYDGKNYYLRRGVLFQEYPEGRGGLGYMDKFEILDLMSHQGRYKKNEVARFYAEMSDKPVVMPDINKDYPEKSTKHETPTINQNQKIESDIPKVLPVLVSNETQEVKNDTIHNVEIRQDVKQSVKSETVVTEEKKEPIKEKKEKEHLEKLNVRKPNGFGLFVDGAGFLFDGPRLGLEMRFNRLIPSVFVGYPALGSQFKKNNDLDETKTISAGAGIKGMIPARWGGIYMGGTFMYERFSGVKNISTLYEQKVFNNDVLILANVGLRFQTKNNLFFNLGGLVGPSIELGQSRYSNILLHDYSSTYKKEDAKIGFKGMGEFSIGYEF